jgi:hypothetical protein
MFIHHVHVSIFTKIEILHAKFIVIFVEKGDSLSTLFWWVFAFQIQDLFEYGKATRWEHFRIIKHKMSKSQSTGLDPPSEKVPHLGALYHLKQMNHKPKHKSVTRQQDWEAPLHLQIGLRCLLFWGGITRVQVSMISQPPMNRIVGNPF